MKGKNIEIKDITSSPLFVIGLLVLICVLVAVGIVLVSVNISETKQDIVDARALLEDNIKQVALLEELKVKSKAAEEQLEACQNILPDDLGDAYILQQNVIEKCTQFGLTVNSISQSAAVNETQEVVFNIGVTAPYDNIYNYLNYYTNLEQVHRFDSLTLAREGDEYSATFTLVFLTEGGAGDSAAIAVGEAIAEVSEAAAS